MKKTFSIIGIIMFTTVTLITSIIFNACKKDETKNCDRSCFYGSWKCSDTNDTGSDISYTVEISASGSDPNGIDIDHFGDAGAVVKAIVNEGSFTVPLTVFGQFVSYEGSGTLSEDGKTIDVIYDTYGGHHWIGTWTKM